MPAAPRETVSACMIVRDEEERLPTALASVAFCDEVIVVDSGSSDRTVEIARAAGATVVENPWPGFAAQRNVAMDRASGDWILEVDADEEVTPRLQAEIQAFLAGPPPPEIDMGALPLRDRFLGRELGPSAKYPKYRYRLFRRDSYRHDERRAVHEGLTSARPVRAFSGDLQHELAASWREALEDAWAYARLEAKYEGWSGSAAGVLKGALLRPPVKLVYRVAVDGGWRDGWQGIAKILLDVTTDAVVAVRRLQAHDDAPEVDRDLPLVGPPRVVALAAGPERAAIARRWLDGARAAGADTVLATDAPPADSVHHVRPLPRVGPLHLIRALDAEQQLRPVDAVVPFGRAAALAARGVPGRLSGPGGLRPQGEEPGETLAAVARARPPEA